MTYKKENSGGRKFQNRQPGEARVRVSKPRPTSTRNSANPGGRLKKSDDGGSFSGPEKKRTFKKFGDSPQDRGDRKPYNRKPSGEGDKSGYGEKRSYGRKQEGEGRSYDKPSFRKTGDKPGYGEKRSYDRKPEGEGRSYDKPSFRKTGDKPSYGEKRSYGRKPEGEGRSYDKPSFRKTGDKPSYGEKRSYDRKGSGESRGFDKPSFRKKEDKPSYGEKRTYGRKPGGDNERSESRNSGKKRSYDHPSVNYKGRGKSYSKASEDLEKGKTLVENETRLNRYIANSGMGSRREADVMIEQGLVSINGKVVTELGTKVRPGDEVKVDGRRINPERPVYILLNKPKGYITTTDDPEGRKTVMELIDLPGSERIYPVGRLDRNTTGVLLLTNDGELAQKLMHPSFEIKKIYKVTLDKKPSKDHMLAWVNGIELEDGFQDFEQCGFVDETDPTVLGVEIHSGRNRIVRRMFEHFGYEVVGLDRVMLGDFDHVKLGRGKWRFLNDKEIAYVERLKRTRQKKR